LAEEEGQQGDDDEVHPAGKVRQLVHLENGVDQEEDQLQRAHHDGADGEVIVVQYIYGHCCGAFAALSLLLSPFTWPFTAHFRPVQSRAVQSFVDGSATGARPPPAVCSLILQNVLPSHRFTHTSSSKSVCATPTAHRALHAAVGGWLSGWFSGWWGLVGGLPLAASQGASFFGAAC